MQSLRGLEILDSRGLPTVKAYCVLRSGAQGAATVPSGASTGSAEAVELRDGDPTRFGGLGCRKAVHSIDAVIAPALVGRPFVSQSEWDAALVAADGTPDKSRLGANALLGCSLAFARARAADLGRPLFEYLAEMAGATPRLPRLMVNLFSGGKHAGGQVAIQDVMVIPLAAASIDASLAIVSAIYREAAMTVQRKYGQRPLVADEGGLAPDFGTSDEMLAAAGEAVAGAGLALGTDVALAVDVAAGHFHHADRYELDGRSLTGAEMIDVLSSWVDRFGLVSVEDGLADDDWPHWMALRSRLEGRAITLGDDLLCTNPGRVARAVELHAATALLLKPNQVGTLTEAREALLRARDAGWVVVISARSGETEDDWLADLAVGWAGDYMKVGSIARSERLAKYNRLLEIEDLGELPLAPSRLVEVTADA
ncbi:MAG: phosphopyruvate hydratase [Candidatus Limnocylindria bacterium]